MIHEASLMHVPPWVWGCRLYIRWGGWSTRRRGGGPTQASGGNDHMQRQHCNVGPAGRRDLHSGQSTLTCSFLEALGFAKGARKD